MVSIGTLYGEVISTFVIVVGSTALKKFGVERYPPKDTDIFLSPEYYQVASPTSTCDCVPVPESILRSIPTEGPYATPDAVYTIKCSHLGWDKKWQKTKLDILWLESLGCRLIPELYLSLRKWWEQSLGDKSFLSLSKDKGKFFEDKVTYVYDHDYLHELIAYPNKPIYTNCLKDGEEVLISKDKFSRLSFTKQVQMFREEVAVIAVERWVVNPTNRGKYSIKEAWDLSLKKTITRLTKGWACDFMCSNLKHFVSVDYLMFENLIDKLNLEEFKMNGAKLVEEILEEFNRLSLEQGDDEMCKGELISEHLTESWGESLSKDYEILAQDGGGEGGGEYCYVVFRWKDKTYKAEYSYYSYDGYDLDGFEGSIREVTPKQKTVTVYE